jgi:hypothetical protein
MDVFEAARTVLAVRSYQNKPVPLGYPTQAVGKGKKQRKRLSEVAHRERFGQPFE